MKHKRDIFPDLASTAVCTGGLTNAYGKVLRHCRSVACPAHRPDFYVGKHAAAGKHAGTPDPWEVPSIGPCSGQHCEGRRTAQWHRQTVSPRHV